MSKLDEAVAAVSGLVTRADALEKRFGDAVVRKDAAYSDPFLTDLRSRMSGLGLPNFEAVFSYVSERRSFDPLTLEDKFGVKIGMSKRIQQEMRELRTMHAEGGAGGNINKVVTQGERANRFLSQKWIKPR